MALELRSLWSNRNSRIMLSLFLLALVVRLIALSSKESLWMDEALTGWRTQSLSSIFEHEQTIPPLFPLLVWMSRQIFGDGSLGLRLPSVLAGAALGPTLYYFISRRFDSRIAFAAGILGVFNAYSIRYSIEARCYALATWLALMHIGLIWEYCREKGDRRGPPFLVWLTGTALIYTHNWGLLLVAGVATGVFLRMVFDKSFKERLLNRLIKIYLAVGASYLVYLSTLLSAARDTEGMTGIWPELPVGVMNRLILGGMLSGSFSELSFLCLSSALILLTFGLPPGDERTFWGWTMLFTLGAASVLQLRLPLYLSGRYDVVFLGGFLAVLALACDSIADRRPRLVCWAIVLGATFLGSYTLLSGPAMSETAKIAALIQQDRAELTLVASTERIDPTLAVPLAYEFGVLRGITPPVLQTPTFKPLQYDYVYIPELYRQGSLLQSMPAQLIQQKVAESVGSLTRVSLIGAPAEVILLREGLPGQWTLLSESSFSSFHEGLVQYLLLERVPEK